MGADTTGKNIEPRMFQAALETRCFGRSVEFKASTGSTNDDAREAALQGAPHGHLVVADQQIAGRGSRGRSWSSPAGSDLYLSLVAQIPLPPVHLPPLTLAVGLAVSDTVDHFCPSPASSVKWPNDVWVQGRKCAGILVETSSSGGLPPTARSSSESPSGTPAVIGVGLNVNRSAWPADLDTPPTSIHQVRGTPADRLQVLATLMARLEFWVEHFVKHGAGPICTALEPRLALRSELVRCDGVEGRLLGVSQLGTLRIQTSTGPREVMSGTLRPLNMERDRD